ncbi:MAG: hypothetical protein QXX06_04045 [Candidatus Diapherotrites archaeon]
MYDKYDSPYSGQESDYSESGFASAFSDLKDLIKGNLKTILAVVVVLVISFFLYDYFFGSVVSVSLVVKDTEGNALEADVKFFSLEGVELFQSSSGSSVRLRKGDYLVNVASPGFKVLSNKPVSVGDISSLDFVLEKNLSVEISGTFPEVFFQGETKELILNFSNKSDTPADVVLVLEGDAKDVFDLSRKSFSVLPGESNVVVQITAKKTLKDIKAFGDNKKAVLRIQGLSNSKAKVQGNYSLLRFDQKFLKVRVDSSDTSVDFRKVKAGQQAPLKAIRIENNSEFDFSGFVPEVEIVESGFIESEKVLEWFSFSPSGPVSVASNSKEQINILLRVPSDLKFPQGVSSEKITGFIKLKNSFFEKSFTLTFEVEAVESKLELSGLRDSYTLRSQNGVYNVETGFVVLRNVGDTLVKDVRARVSCPLAEGANWLLLENSSELSIGNIEKGSNKTVPFRIVVPNSVRANTIVDCTLQVFYVGLDNASNVVEKKTTLTAS